MNAPLHQITHGGVYFSMTRYRGQAGKGMGDDGDPEVAAFPGTGMSGMAMRFVLDVETQGVEGGEALAQQCEGGSVIVHAGNTLRKGLTLTRT